ncbi:MAG: RidA family protein [Opitutaceae bacterium]|nr:RidA family protein [Opitutaceae bacterium]
MRTFSRFVLLLIIPACIACAQVAGVHRAAKPMGDGTAFFARVPDAPLVFTGQIFAPQMGGEIRAECEGALDALAATLANAGSDLAHVARLTVYAAEAEATVAAEAAIAQRFAAAPVALTIVRTPLARAGAWVGFEAVAVSSRTEPGVAVLSSEAAVLPAGGKIFISGQAVRGADLATASRLTMAGLHRSLTHLSLAAADVVQVKAFIRPFAGHAAAVRAIAESFGSGTVPPIVVMEWVSELHAEIELVAAARSIRAPEGETVVHSRLPWLTPSPRYSHVALVPAGVPLIFIGAIESDAGGDPRAQMKAIFERIGSVLFDAGGSYRNLAKATYYLHAPPTRALLGEIRGVYFDSTRPPAASALQVAAPAHAGRAAAIELIAVPVK